MVAKRTESKSLVTYQVIVRGNIPEKLKEHLSAIHARSFHNSKLNSQETTNPDDEISPADNTQKEGLDPQGELV